jgi:hypothetical protein
MNSKNDKIMWFYFILNLKEKEIIFFAIVELIYPKSLKITIL